MSRSDAPDPLALLGRAIALSVHVIASQTAREAEAAGLAAGAPTSDIPSELHPEVLEARAADELHFVLTAGRAGAAAGVLVGVYGGLLIASAASAVGVLRKVRYQPPSGLRALSEDEIAQVIQDTDRALLLTLYLLKKRMDSDREVPGEGVLAGNLERLRQGYVAIKHAEIPGHLVVAVDAKMAVIEEVLAWRKRAAGQLAEARALASRAETRWQTLGASEDAERCRKLVG